MRPVGTAVGIGGSPVNLLAAGVLGDGFGALADGVLGKFTREEKTNCGLDLPTCDGGPLVVVRES